MSFDPLYAEPICVVHGQAGGLNGRRVTYALLAKQELVLQRRDSSVRRALNEAFLRHGGQPPRPDVETSNYMQSISLVAGSTFFTVVPLHAAQSQDANGTARILDFNLGVAPMEVSFICRKTSEENEQLKRFALAFKAVLPER